MKKFLLSFVLLSGCSAAQMDKTDAWLAKPSATHPGMSNEQAINQTAKVVGETTGPIGSLIASGLGAILIGYHEFSSRRRSNKNTIQNQEILDVASSPKVVEISPASAGKISEPVVATVFNTVTPKTK